MTKKNFIKIDSIHLSDLKPADYNPRKINEEQYKQLEKSLNEYGFVEPMLIDLKDDNTIIGGHQRFKILSEELENGKINDKIYLIKLGDIGWAFTDLDLEVKDRPHQLGLNIALNKTGGEWDNEKLKDVLSDLNVLGFDTKLTGFNDLELHELTFADTIEYEEDDIDNLESLYEPPEEKTEKKFKCSNCNYEGFKSEFQK